MNKTALSPVLATICLTSLSIGSAAAMETDLQIGPTDLTFGAELANKHYDQGVIRNENVTAIGHADARFWDVGLHLDYYMAINSDRSQPETVAAFETTQINLGIDYLFEITDLFQFIPHYYWTTYPNRSESPYKNDQNWIGLDVWYLLPIQGMEVGTSIDYNPLYNSRRDDYTGEGGGHGHDFRFALAARQFIQNAPLDVSFFEVLNFGNGTYKQNFFGMDDEPGVTTFDIGVKYISPFFLNEFWMTARLEGHFWLENDDREHLRAAGRNTAEVIMALGFEWKPVLTY